MCAICRYLDGEPLGPSDIESHVYSRDGQRVIFTRDTETALRGKHTITCEAVAPDGSTISSDLTYDGQRKLLLLYIIDTANSWSALLSNGWFDRRISYWTFLLCTGNNGGVYDFFSTLEHLEEIYSVWIKPYSALLLKKLVTYSPQTNEYFGNIHWSSDFLWNVFGIPDLVSPWNSTSMFPEPWEFANKITLQRDADNPIVAYKLQLQHSL